MEPIIYNLRLDEAKMGSQASVTVKHGDVQTRLLRVRLYAGSTPVQLTKGSAAVLRGIKPDGHILYNDCAVNGNVIEQIVTEQMMAAPGVVACELTVYSPEYEVLSTPCFDLLVEDLLIPNSAIESKDEFTALSEVMMQLTRLKAEAGDHEQGRAEAEASRALEEQGRGSAEAQRAVDEQERIQNEQKRIQNEQARILAESTRISDEGARLTAEVSRETAEKDREGLYHEMRQKLENKDFDGLDGLAATLEIGEFKTLPPGSENYVVNVGTETNAVLNIGIAKGVPGAVQKVDGVSPDTQGNVVLGAAKQADLTAHTGDAGKHVSPGDRVKWDAMAPGSVAGTTGPISQLAAPDVYDGFPLDVTARLVAKQTVTVQGKNLLDLNRKIAGSATINITNISNGVRLTYTGASSSTGATYAAFFLIKSYDAFGKQFTFRGNWVSNGVSNVVNMRLAWFTGSATTSSISGSSISISGNSTTITIPSSAPTGEEKIVVILYANNGGTISAGDYVDFTNIQLELGPTATAYEPFTPNSPSPDYPAPITGRNSVEIARYGVNLLNSDLLLSINGVAKTGNEYTIPGTSLAAVNSLKLWENKSRYPGLFSISYYVRHASGETTRGATARFWYTDGTNSTDSTPYTTTNVYRTFVSSAEKVVSHIVFTYGTSIMSYLSNIQLELGSVPTPYEPYAGAAFPVTLPETGWGLPAVNDSVLSNGLWNKKTILVTFTGNEPWIQSNTTGSTYRYALSASAFQYPPKATASASAVGNAVCSHYPIGSNNSVYYQNLGFATTQGSEIVFYDPNHNSSLADWKSWITAQCAAGTPVQVLYELATPQTLSVPPVTIPALPGLNNTWTDTGGDTSTALNPFGGMLSQLKDAKTRIAALEQVVAKI